MIAVLAIMLSACGGSGITQTSQTQRYQLQLTLDGLGGKHLGRSEGGEQPQDPGRRFHAPFTGGFCTGR